MGTWGSTVNYWMKPFTMEEMLFAAKSAGQPSVQSKCWPKLGSWDKFCLLQIRCWCWKPSNMYIRHSSFGYLLYWIDTSITRQEVKNAFHLKAIPFWRLHFLFCHCFHVLHASRTFPGVNFPCSCTTKSQRTDVPLNCSFKIKCLRRPPGQQFVVFISTEL